MIDEDFELLNNFKKIVDGDDKEAKFNLAVKNAIDTADALGLCAHCVAHAVIEILEEEHNGSLH